MSTARFSMKTSLTANIFIMGLLVIIFTIITGEIYRNLIFSNQKAAFTLLAESKVDHLLKETIKQTSQLGLSLQSSTEFKTAFTNRDQQALVNQLNQSFHRAFVTLNILELTKIQVYDSKLELIASSEEGELNYHLESICPELSDTVKNRKGASRIKPVSRLCLKDSSPRLTTIVPIGGIWLKGYLLISINPIRNLSTVSSDLVTPLQIILRDDSIAYQSSNWKSTSDNMEITSSIFDLASDEKTILTFKFSQDIDNLINELAITRIYIIAAAISVTLITIIFSLTVLKRSTLDPLTRLTRYMHDVTEDKSRLQHKVEPRGNAEIMQLTEDLNTMSYQLHTMYDTLENMAYTDSLTHMHNRAYLFEQLQTVCKHTEEKNHHFALFMMDLNRFKYINDTLGHHIGDLVLQELSSRLSISLRDGDVAARLGGDEFAVMLPTVETPATAVKVATKISNALRQPIEIESHKLNIDVSIGIVLCPKDTNDPHNLMKFADIAMYHCKQNNLCYAFYDKSMDNESLYEFTMEPKLREAIESGLLDIYYQPKIQCSSQTVLGVEALTRWNDSELGFISPETFIPLAERTGLIHSLTEWVLTSAFNQVNEWREAGIDLNISVNLSSLSLNESHIIKMLENLISENPSIGTDWLTLELTESTIMSDPENALGILTQLDEFNVKLSIDDFGTGYSSLSYLKQLPVDEIKIDKSFVMSMLEDNNDAVIVKSTIDLAHNMGLIVVAEGIETQEIWDSLIDMKCDLAQGFFMKKPSTADEITEWLKTDKYTFRASQRNPLKLIN